MIHEAPCKTISTCNFDNLRDTVACAKMTASQKAVEARLGLNDNKAGMEGLDKEKINKIIIEASKGRWNGVKSIHVVTIGLVLCCVKRFGLHTTLSLHQVPSSMRMN